MTRFACAKLIRRYIITAGIFSLVLGSIAGLVSQSVLVGIILFLDFAIWMTGIPLLINRNAFSRVTVDKNGIRNKYIGFSWAEMENYRIIDLKIGYGGIGLSFMREEILCFGEIPSNRSFIGLNPRKAVFIILDQKTKKAMASFSNNQFLV
ncbi:MAG: hypothetical protein IJW00_03425 [Clostridia bacterium]|nr:hypothetical protein [Clostridia bacterium]